MPGTRSPSQDIVIICARRIQSAGACRAPASLRIVRSSTASTGGRANNSFGMVAPHRDANPRDAQPIPALKNAALIAVLGGWSVGWCFFAGGQVGTGALVWNPWQQMIPFGHGQVAID